MVLVQTGFGTVSGNIGLPRLETKRSHVFGKIPDRDRDHGVWSGPDWVPIGLGPNFPNTSGWAGKWVGMRAGELAVSVPVGGKTGGRVVR